MRLSRTVVQYSTGQYRQGEEPWKEEEGISRSASAVFILIFKQCAVVCALSRTEPVQPAPLYLQKLKLILTLQLNSRYFYCSAALCDDLGSWIPLPSTFLLSTRWCEIAVNAVNVLELAIIREQSTERHNVMVYEHQAEQVNVRFKYVVREMCCTSPTAAT